MTVRALTIDCDYTDYKQGDQQTLYQCNVKNVFKITQPDTIIESANGAHTKGRSDSMVEYIFINKKGIINYFPSGLKEVFTKLLKIEITEVELMEIHQNDLKPFTDLEFLILDNNQLKYSRLPQL